jgi:hypothetical protein
MTTTFLESRGTVYVVSGGQPSLYQVEGLQGAHILIRGVSFDANETVAEVATLGDMLMLYSFGSKFTSLAVTGEVLLGGVDKNDGVSSMKAVFDWYSENRVSTKKAPVGVSIAGTGGVPMYVVGLSVGVGDQELRTVPFVLAGKAAM